MSSHPSPGVMAPGGLSALLPGLFLTGLLATAAIVGGRLGWIAGHGISALTLAIVLGMLVGHTLLPHITIPHGPGVAFAKQRLLRIGIALFGLRLTFQDIAALGWPGVLTDTLVLATTFGIACLIGIRWLGLDRSTTMLIGAGSAICGAAAVMAAAPVVRGRSDQVTVAVSTVVVFGTIAMFLYPALYTWLDWEAGRFGLYIGSTVHEVAQVVAAGRAISDETADTAVITKLVRVMMLAPFLLLMAAWLARSDEACERPPVLALIPWFAVGFIAIAALHSMVGLPPTWVALGNDVATALLAMAMAALGLTTHVSAVRQAGTRPLLLAGLLFAWLIGGGLLINVVAHAVLGA